MASPQRIDEINILQATYEAMQEAISKLKVTPQLLLNDAVTIPQVTIPQVPIIKGDAKSASIAAASIVAKVTRDRMMVEYDKTLRDTDLLPIRAMAHRSTLKPQEIWSVPDTQSKFYHTLRIKFYKYQRYRHIKKKRAGAYQQT